MIKLYIFNQTTRASVYGIGTYINQLVTTLKNEKKITVTIINLDTPTSEILVLNQNNIRYIHIPSCKYDNLRSNDLEKFLVLWQNVIIYLLKPYINQDDKNIFHFNYPRYPLLATMLKEKFGGKNVLTLHSTEWSLDLLGNKQEFKRLLKRYKEGIEDKNPIVEGFLLEKDFINHCCDKVIAISQHSYNDLINIYEVNEKKLVLINNALTDTYKYSSRKRKENLKQKYLIDVNSEILIFAGRLEEVKGVRILIEAFKILIKEHPNVHLFILGDGNMYQFIRESAPVWTKITFTGFVLKEIVNELYSIADMGIVPSIHEEFGYVCIEMLMQKIPVIVSNSTGLKEIITDKVNGLYFDVKAGETNIKKSAKQIAEKITLLLNNNKLRKQIAQKGRLLFLEKYDIGLFKKKMFENYNELL